MCLFDELSLDTGKPVGYRDHRRTDAAEQSPGRGSASIDQGQGAMRGPMHPGSLPQESRVELRRAACSDLLKLFEIHRAVFLPHIAQIWGWDERWQRGNFLEEMATASTWVVQADNEVAGYLQVQIQAERIYLRNIALLPALRGRGVGTRLVGQLQAKAAERGMPIELSVFRINVAARRFYERLGFTRTQDGQTHIGMTWHSPEHKQRGT
ncbi:GNAT family N-acetyltransferase [Stutzerimonas nitrititolerans]|uniref:GNAT family N-acetyltransferase n=1 Tax=Stutzerimonas nitrititolerans TaxID=2482751 RepID=UPI0028A61863|nr:GNAT family N-acetyltransferase [Stutzerimonas nitrititolerans]